MKQAKPLRYKPIGNSEREINQAIRELKGHIAFINFCDALYNLRETALSRLWDDNVISNERVSLAYQVEARVYQDILNRIADAGDVGNQEVIEEQT